jgi:hypothetical protein
MFREFKILRATNLDLDPNIKLELLCLHSRCYGNNNVTNNEFYFWFVKSYITQEIDVKVNQMKVISSITRKKFWTKEITKWKCRNPSFGLVTKARACEGAGQEWARESHFMLLGVQESAREWTFTLPNERQPWELESQWTPKSLEEIYKGQNSLDWEFPYIMESSWNVDV